MEEMKMKRIEKLKLTDEEKIPLQKILLFITDFLGLGTTKIIEKKNTKIHQNRAGTERMYHGKAEFLIEKKGRKVGNIYFDYGPTYNYDVNNNPYHCRIDLHNIHFEKHYENINEIEELERLVLGHAVEPQEKYFEWDQPGRNPGAGFRRLHFGGC